MEARGLRWSRLSTSENAKAPVVFEAEHGGSLAGCGNLGLDIRAINPLLGPLFSRGRSASWFEQFLLAFI